MLQKQLYWGIIPVIMHRDSGTFSFDEKHNPVKTVSIIEVQNGVTVDIYEVEPPK